MEDEKKRNNISEGQLNLERERHTLSRLGGRDRKIECPECKKQAFYYHPGTGVFYCFGCGIHGKLEEYQKDNDKYYDHKAANREPPLRQVKPVPAREKEQGGRMLLQDYGALPDMSLDAIEDVSLEESVTGAQSTVRHYLEEMHIPLELAHLMGVGVAQRHMKLEGEETGSLRNCIVYRNYVEGYCCNAKFRSVQAKTVDRLVAGKKRRYTSFEKGFDQESATKPCAPYNIDSLRPTTDPDGQLSILYITEGEKDCLSLLALGFTPAISVASGAATNHEKSFQAFEEWLRPVRTVVICVDQDERGREMADSLAEYFADREVRVAQWDKRSYGKDISDVRLKVGDEVARQLVQQAVAVRQEDIIEYGTDEELHRVIDNARGLWDRGFDVGMGPLVDAHLRLNGAGGLMVATGTPGSGKTDFINYLTLHLSALRGSHVCYCSFETPDKYRHAAQLAQLWAGATSLETMTAEEVEPIVRRVTGCVTHLELARHNPSPQLILKKAELVLKRHPDMQYLVIDPYLYISLPAHRQQNQTDAIKEMLVEFAAWARDRKVWLILVAHPRMLQQSDGSSDFEDINYYTIAGSAHWANVSDYIISIRRIKGKATEYTELSVLKVRDQSLCRPGTVLLQRQPCGRYDARTDKEQCLACNGPCDEEPWG